MTEEITANKAISEALSRWYTIAATARATGIGVNKLYNLKRVADGLPAYDNNLKVPNTLFELAKALGYNVRLETKVFLNE